MIQLGSVHQLTKIRMWSEIRSLKVARRRAAFYSMTDAVTTLGVLASGVETLLSKVY